MYIYIIYRRFRALMSPASGMGRSEVETCLVNLYIVYIYMCMCVYACMCICICIYVYIYMCIRIYEYSGNKVQIRSLRSVCLWRVTLKLSLKFEMEFL